MNKWSSIVLYSAAFVITTQMFSQVFQFFFTKKSENKKNCNTQNFFKVLFFPDAHIPCRRHLLTPNVSKIYSKI